jgi:hypothetical protein
MIDFLVFLLIFAWIMNRLPVEPIKRRVLFDGDAATVRIKQRLQPWIEQWKRYGLRGWLIRIAG